MKILFTGGGGVGNEAIWNILSKKYSLFFADIDINKINPVIPAERRVTVPLARDLNFSEKIRDVCDMHNIDVLVPGVDEEIEALSRLRDEVPFRIMLPKQDFATLMLDKLRCFESMKSHGLSVPETRLLINSSSMSFPLVAKPRSGRGSRGVMVLSSYDQTRAYLQLQRDNDDAYIGQQLVHGKEYTVFVDSDKNSELRAIVPVRVDVKRGITIKAESDSNPRIIDYVKKFHKTFSPGGVYNMQCILDEGGRIWPFEVNPRVSTTFCLALFGGYDPFEESEKGADFFTLGKSVKLERYWVNKFVLDYD